jgi:replicative DNA helicase
LVPDALPPLVPEAFYRTGHQLIFRAMQSVEVIDTLTVADYLRSKDELDRAGGAAYLSDLTDAVPSVAHIEHHADIVAKHHKERCVIQATYGLADSAYMGEVDEGLAEFDEKIATTEMGTDKGRTVGDLLKPTFDSLEARYNGEAPGFVTGYQRLDRNIQMCPGDLIALAGRPGMGKSGLAIGIARRGAAEGQHVLLVSLEMTEAQVMQRLLSQVSRVDSRCIRSGQLKDNDWGKLTHAAGKVKELPLTIVEDAYTSRGWRQGCGGRRAWT